MRILIFRVGRYSIIQGEKGCCRSYVAAIICESARVPSRRKKKERRGGLSPRRPVVLKRWVGEAGAGKEASLWEAGAK